MKPDNEKIYRTYTVTRGVDAQLSALAVQDDRSKSQMIRWLITQEAKRRAAQRKEERSND